MKLRHTVVTEDSNGRSHTTPKQRGGITGKGFVKGDPRINRGGRPKSFDQFRELAKSIAGERILDGKMTLAEALLRKCAKSGEPALIKTFFEYAFGKVPDKLEATGLENKTHIIVHLGNEHPELRSRLANGLS